MPFAYLDSTNTNFANMLRVYFGTCSLSNFTIAIRCDPFIYCCNEATFSEEQMNEWVDGWMVWHYTKEPDRHVSGPLKYVPGLHVRQTRCISNKDEQWKNYVEFILAINNSWCRTWTRSDCRMRCSSWIRHLQRPRTATSHQSHYIDHFPVGLSTRSQQCTHINPRDWNRTKPDTRSSNLCVLFPHPPTCTKMN